MEYLLNLPTAKFVILCICLLILATTAILGFGGEFMQLAKAIFRFTFSVIKSIILIPIALIYWLVSCLSFNDHFSDARYRDEYEEASKRG
jgi:hypothetical protein